MERCRRKVPPAEFRPGSSRIPRQVGWMAPAGASGGLVVGQLEERRKWPRLEVAFKIRLKELVGKEEALQREDFYTKNISTGGLLFESGEDLSVSEGSVLGVEISMPLAKYGFASSRRLEARGRVCRIGAARQEKAQREVALEFMAPPRFVTA